MTRYYEIQQRLRELYERQRRSLSPEAVAVYNREIAYLETEIATILYRS